MRLQSGGWHAYRPTEAQLEQLSRAMEASEAAAAAPQGAAGQALVPPSLPSQFTHQVSHWAPRIPTQKDRLMPLRMSDQPLEGSDSRSAFPS